MTQYLLRLPDKLYERVRQLCKQYFRESKECIDKIFLLALEEGLRIVERRLKLEMLVPKEEKYDVEKFIEDVRSGRKG